VQDTTDPSPVQDAQKQQQGHTTGHAFSAQKQQQQQTPQQQQQQEGLLGPVTEPGHALEVDRVVERELLDSNGKSDYSNHRHLRTLADDPTGLQPWEGCEWHKQICIT
jgi:hypothetical protein